MLKHRVQTVAMPNAPPGVGSYSDEPIPTSSATQPTIEINQQNACAGTDPNYDSQLGTARGNTKYSSVQSGQYCGYPAPPPQVEEHAQYNSEQAINDIGNHGYNNQQYISNTSPSHTADGRAYNATSGVQKPTVISLNIEQPSSALAQDAKDGLRIITEKYDSLNKLTVSPQKSPMGSPSSDGGSFSFTDMIMSQKFREGVTEQDLLQVDTFYRSHKSEVYVCGCLVNMYFGSAKNALNNDQWEFSSTGIPLLLLDTGEHHRERKLYIILAEKGTGFTMWRDVIDNQTGYRTPNANFHTMHTSKDHTKLAGFSFDDAKAASEFYGHIHKLTADPDDELLKFGKSKKKKSIKDKKKKVKLPKKTEISQPCCFVHVTKLDRPMTEDGETPTPTTKSSNPNEISAPFNFQHVTGPSGTGNDLSTSMGSKLTLTSTSSVDSGLSDDRSSAKAGN